MQIEIIIMFRAFIVELLKKAIQIMSLRNVESYKRTFLEYAVAYSFFRGPLFRSFLLAHLEKSENLIGQEKALAAVDEQCENLYTKNKNGSDNIITQAFDWKRLYDHIPQENRDNFNLVVEKLL